MQAIDSHAAVRCLTKDNPDQAAHCEMVFTFNRQFIETAKDTSVRVAEP